MKVTGWIIAGGIVAWLLTRARGALADVVEDNGFIAGAKRVAERFGLTLEVAVIALVIAGESGGEPRDGQLAVGWVMRNRRTRGYGHSYADIAQARNQFEPVTNCLRGQSAFCDRMANGVTSDIVYLAQGVYNGALPDTSRGAVNFYSPATQAALGRPAPTWASTMKLTAVIGGHRFYT